MGCRRASGSPCLAYAAECPPGPGPCFENVRLKLQRNGAAIAAEMTAGDFNALAYLEVDVATDSTAADTGWGVIRLWSSNVFVVEPIPMGGGGSMRTYQIPLRTMTYDGAVQTYADLTADGFEEVASATSDAGQPTSGSPHRPALVSAIGPIAHHAGW